MKNNQKMSKVGLKIHCQRHWHVLKRDCKIRKLISII